VEESQARHARTADSKDRQDRGKDHGSFAWFLTVTETAGQSSPGHAAVLDLSLDEFVARANRFLNFSMKKAPLYAEPAFVTPSEGVFTRTFRWVGREGQVQFNVVQNEKLQKIRDICAGARPMRRRCRKARSDSPQ
jgi:hypothetical protein